MPCVRYRLTEAKFVTTADHPPFLWSQRWKENKIVELQTWASDEIKTIILTQDVEGGFLPLKVRQFIPEAEDELHRTWSIGGVERRHRCATFAIANMADTVPTLLALIQNQVVTFIVHYVQANDGLLRATYVAALEHMTKAKVNCSLSTKSIQIILTNTSFHQTKKERDLLRDVFYLWVAIRLGSRSDRIIGNETLGTQPQNYDPQAPNYGHVLVPPIISAQIELISTVEILLPLQESIRRRLQEFVEANDAKLWLTIYLCNFILLHSCSLLTSYQSRKAKKLGLRVCFSSASHEVRHANLISRDNFSALHLWMNFTWAATFSSTTFITAIEADGPS